MNLQINNITVCQDEDNIVENISFNIESGQILGLIGANGSGKSTLLKALIDSVPKFGTANLVKTNQEKLAQPNSLTFGFVPEEPILYDYLSVIGNFQLTSVAKGVQDNHSEIINIIRILRLDLLANRKAQSLSQGEKKRLAIGLSLIGNPDVMILDEPHNGLDVEGLAILKKIIRVKCKDHIIILCSHFFSEIEALCDKILLLDQGRDIVYDSIENLRKQYQSVENMFNIKIYKSINEEDITF